MSKLSNDFACRRDAYRSSRFSRRFARPPALAERRPRNDEKRTTKEERRGEVGGGEGAEGRDGSPETSRTSRSRGAEADRNRLRIAKSRDSARSLSMRKERAESLGGENTSLRRRALSASLSRCVPAPWARCDARRTLDRRGLTPATARTAMTTQAKPIRTRTCTHAYMSLTPFARGKELRNRSNRVRARESTRSERGSGSRGRDT